LSPLHITLIAGAFAILAALLGAVVGPIIAKRISRTEESRGRSVATRRPCAVDDAPIALLFDIWEYPDRGGNHVSWAVKESAALLGRMEYARDEPGLGVAIISTDVASAAFGSTASGKIGGVIAWAVSRTQQTEPHMVLVKKVEPITLAEEWQPDFRHSLALGVILARFDSHPHLLASYLSEALRLQSEDGGWPPGEGATISEVFTVFYAVEFLSLCASLERLDASVRLSCLESRDRGLRWLVSSVGDDGLWSGGVLEFAWESLHASAWLLHRLAPVVPVEDDEWRECVHGVLATMVRRVADSSTWASTEARQRFQVEARVAAAVRACVESLHLPGTLAEACDDYLKGWCTRYAHPFEIVPRDEVDLATELFALCALVPRATLSELGQQCLKIQSAERPN
jgi:hypothetical protein